MSMGLASKLAPGTFILSRSSSTIVPGIGGSASPELSRSSTTMEAMPPELDTTPTLFPSGRGMRAKIFV